MSERNISAEYIPDELKERPQWVLWKPCGNSSKMPFQVSGNPAKSNDPSTWTTFGEVLAAYDRGGYIGIGYVFSEDDPFCGIDLDGCRYVGKGEISDWAQKVIDRLGSYSEISPSGSGIKIFVRGKLPLSSGKNKKLPQFGGEGGKEAGIEIYDHGRFFAVTGQQLPQMSNITYCDFTWLLGEFGIEISARNQPAIPQLGVIQPPDDNSIRRASLYLAQCDVAVQGQGGHSKLLYAAGRMVNGFLLSDTQTYDLLTREYNPRCIPPWDLSDKADERDFRRKISEARRLGSKESPGWLLTDSAYAPAATTTTVDVGALMEKVRDKVTKRLYALPPLHPPGELQFLCRPTGLLGDICSWINSTAIREQPLLSVGCVLAFLGALFGRKVRDEQDGRTSLYCMGVADSSAGKAHAMEQIKKICTESGCTRLLGGSDLASDSSLEDRISREPATIFLWDEVGFLLSVARGSGSTHLVRIVPLLMKLYSSARTTYIGREYADNSKQRVVEQPCCCIYGTSTIERFADGVTKMDLHDGWLSRCLLFLTESKPEKQRGIKHTDLVPPEICEKVGLWFMRNTKDELNALSAKTASPEDVAKNAFMQHVDKFYNPTGPVQITVPTEVLAETIFRKLEKDSEQYGANNKPMECLWAKSEENARRIALIIAAGNSFDNPVITPQIADYACRLVVYLLRDFSAVIAPAISETKIEQDRHRVYRVICNSSHRGLKKREITRKTQWLNKNGRDTILVELLESGEVVLCRVEGERTPAYWARKFFPGDVPDD